MIHVCCFVACSDEDMQSTFSAMSAGNESLQFDEDDEDDTTVVTAEG